MTLYNKDGSVYTLSGPNPLMRDQKFWEDFTTHNMKWNAETDKDRTEVTPLASDFFTDTFKDGSFVDALKESKDDIKVSEVKVESIIEPEKVETNVTETRTPITRHDTKNDLTPDEIEKTFIHCLPASIREKKDSLYGDVYRTVQYGKPFSFEGVLTAHTDFQIDIWTDAREISIGSIIYPKIGLKRWWRVQEKVAKGSGWLLQAMPSDYHPSFEEQP